MIKLKSLIKEYISNDLIYLKRYLNMSSKEQKIELVYNNPHLVKQFAEEYFDPQIKKFILQNEYEDYEIVDEFQKKYPNEFNDFLDWSHRQLVNGKIYEIPTWYVMRFQNIVKNQWLIHFSDNARQIWSDQKFTYGIPTEDLDRLGYSTSYKMEYKKGGGFNFAYDINDFAKYGRSNYRGNSWKYGKEAVMFKASGIKAYHYGDEEPQVIFVGNSANSIVLLEYNKSDGDWMVTSNLNRIIFRTQTLSDLVDWVISNFDQYKRVLLP